MPGPLIISTWSFGQRGNTAAWPALHVGGCSLDAVETACCAVERDPQVDSVGFGGLPDCAGHVSLDGCIMLGPGKCGSVCAVRRYMHPVSIARRVMETTNHIMLAGEGAETFAEAHGFTPADLLSAEAQDAFAQWKKNHAPLDQSRDSGLSRSFRPPRPVDRPASTGRLFLHPAPDDFDESSWKHHDTIGVLALDSAGVLAGACSTSGTPFKLPGRIGDSPIIGHGLYVDPKFGAAVATGTGELIMDVCGSFLAVELLRRGAKPLDAACVTLRRITESHDIQPEHQVGLIVLTQEGEFASAAIKSGYKTSIRTKDRDEVIDPDAVLI